MPTSEIPTGERRSWMPYDDYPDLIWEYTHLNEPELTAKFEELAHWGSDKDTAYATLQPCVNPHEGSQDRHIIQSWDIDGKEWRFRAVFDGHGGHETVDYTLQHLPVFLLERLADAVRAKPQWTGHDISKVLQEGIVAFDDGIGQAFLDLFPGDSIRDLSEEEVKAIVNAPENVHKALRCMRGTTVLISLVDPRKKNLWVASLGDCTAILGTKTPSGAWSAQTLSYNHNGQNQAESSRVTLEHAGEEGCMQDDRVLGAIAVTRAIGDFVFKHPAIYTQRGLLNVEVGFRTQRKVEDLLPRVLTPPYVSNIPQISHIPLSTSSNSSALLMYSDGLGDLYEDEFREVMKAPGFWPALMGKILDAPSSGSTGSENNAAMRFIRLGIGADDAVGVSRSLTTEYLGRWMDDTTVLVVRL